MTACTACISSGLGAFHMAKIASPMNSTKQPPVILMISAITFGREGAGGGGGGSVAAISDGGGCVRGGECWEAGKHGLGDPLSLPLASPKTGLGVHVIFT